LSSKQDSDQDKDSYLLEQDWSQTRKNLSANTSDAQLCSIYQRWADCHILQSRSSPEFL